MIAIPHGAVITFGLACGQIMVRPELARTCPSARLTDINPGFVSHPSRPKYAWLVSIPARHALTCSLWAPLTQYSTFLRMISLTERAGFAAALLYQLVSAPVFLVTQTRAQ